ncbi:hypothetical protein K525DRAFT_271980 [Schizophyllum commune Loenen D]|nr:hypothetical protein K525DRAFT_271980 [Schizophyllum commune Loenen D]
MLANPGPTDPTRRALNIDTACNLAMIYHPPPRGPMPLAYRPRTSDFLPTSQHGGDGPRPTNASGAPSTASGVRSTTSGTRSTTGGVRWKIPTSVGAESVTDAERIEIMREELKAVCYRVRVQEVSYGGGRNRREIFARVEEGERKGKSSEAPQTSEKDD